MADQDPIPMLTSSCRVFAVAEVDAVQEMMRDMDADFDDGMEYGADYPDMHFDGLDELVMFHQYGDNDSDTDDAGSHGDAGDTGSHVSSEWDDPHDIDDDFHDDDTNLLFAEFDARRSREDLTTAEPTPSLQSLAATLAHVAFDRVDEFMFGGSADALPSIPGLVIDGVGRVPLPIVDPALADRIKAVARKGQERLGIATTEDPKLWQIDPKCVHLTHPRWDDGINALMAEIATHLGCEGMPLQIQFDNLLLFEPGGHVVKHEEMGAHDPVFALIFLQLPSDYKGGDLVVYRNTSSSGDSGRDPVVDGYRLALVYSLCWPEHQVKRPLDAAMTATIAQQLTIAAQSVDFFQLFFVHQYSTRIIREQGIGLLKGVDKARFAALHAANASLPLSDRFEFYLMSCTRTVPLADCTAPESQAYYHLTDWSRVALNGACSNVSKINWRRDKFPFDAMAATVNPDEHLFTNLWIYGPPSTEMRVRDDGRAISETVWKRYVLVAVPVVKELKFARKYFGLDAAMDTFHAMLHQPGFTDDPDWILIMLRALGACKKRDFGWEKTLLARAARAGDVAAVLLVLDMCPVLLYDEDGALKDLVSTIVWPHVAANLVTRIRIAGSYEGFEPCLRAAEAAVKSGMLPDARRADLIDGLLIAYHAEEDYSRTCVRSAWFVAAKAGFRRTYTRTLVDLAMRTVPALSPSAIALVPAVRTVYARLAAVVHAQSRVQYPDDAEIDAFLRGTTIFGSIRGRFTGIADARMFAAQHSASPRFSAEACGRGARAFVALTRTDTDAHEKSLQECRDAKDTMRKSVEFFGEGVVIAANEGDTVDVDIAEVQAAAAGPLLAHE
ncbi:hypothetical protein GGF32_009737 [Allomyces javanicus]|nr:hypothetical protein GGF32_009737 [Allomyces javanicus]